MTKWILVMPKSGSGSGSILRVGGWKIRIRVASTEWVFASPSHYKMGICSHTTTVCVEMEPNLLKSSLFHADQRLCSAEILPPSQVRARIEVAVLNFLKNITASNPAISNLPLVCLSVSVLSVSPCSGFASNLCWKWGFHGVCRSSHLIAISDSPILMRSLMRANDAKAFVRVWMVMAMCFRILVQGKLATQRELFYKLLCDAPEYFRSQRQVNRAVQDVVALLRCTRHSLGIMASSRGAVIGRMVLEEPGEQIVDCSMIGHAGYAITGDLCTLSKLVLHSDARYIIIIEKDAIFQRLAEDHFFNQIPCILITSKGYPDIATSSFHCQGRGPQLPLLLTDTSKASVAHDVTIHSFHHRCCHPSVAFFVPTAVFTASDKPDFSRHDNLGFNGLVDPSKNPAGLAILCTYKFGSIRTGLESYRYACNVKWLGLRADDLQIIPQKVMMQLKPHDIKTAKSLMSSKLLQERYQAELSLMVERGHRAEIEALYCHGFDFLRKYITKKIVQADYI
ncbi:Type IIB DNA topoisomerase [Musa troglodytarum]|uniref:DNA topoisomerase (ATP-hydrolyzing) n=1 Tax=Musa troglodytarum TaxID=320322 RepID=A0A9E7FDY4_9LILI|nr:Type IIB DNA topoisomerase [Musa troglodytarum]